MFSMMDTFEIPNAVLFDTDSSKVSILPHNLKHRSLLPGRPRLLQYKHSEKSACSECVHVITIVMRLPI